MSDLELTNTPLASSPEPRSPTASRWRPRLPRTPGRRLVFLALYLGFCWGVVWLGVRLFWLVGSAVPFSQRPSAWDHYYPRLRQAGLVEQPAARPDKRFDLLLLGGSVLDPAWGSVGAELERRLESRLPGRWRLANLGQAGFTSRDSLLQYQHLARQRFDLVVVYDGINDTRLNCCPPELFRDDYTHAIWYRQFAEELAGGTPSLSRVAVAGVRSALDRNRLGTPEPELLEFAAQPQTPRCLRANLSTLCDLAVERGDPLVLLTFAWHIPPEYTLQKFGDDLLDYAPQGKNRCAAELWGKAEYVAHALRLQNDEIRALAADWHTRSSTAAEKPPQNRPETPPVRLLDMEERLPHTGEIFIDPCHLTERGSAEFVEILWPVVAEAIESFERGEFSRR
jgi:hypothetical protein